MTTCFQTAKPNCDSMIHESFNINPITMNVDSPNQSNAMETNFPQMKPSSKNWLHSTNLNDSYALLDCMQTNQQLLATTATSSSPPYSSVQSQLNRQQSVIQSNSRLSTVTANPSSLTTTGPKKGGRFRPNWLVQFEWLRYDQTKDIMYCMFCRRWLNDIPDIRTSFAEGSSNFRLEILNHHDRCKAHKVCTEHEMQFNRMHDNKKEHDDTNQHQL